MTRLRLFRFAGFFALLVGFTAFAQQPDETPKTDVPASFRCYVVIDKRTYDGEPKIVKDEATNIPKHVYVKEPKRDPKNRTEKMHCLVCDQGLNPTVAVFARSVPKADDPLSKLAIGLRGLMRIEKYKAMNLGAFIAFLTLDKEFQLDDKRDEADLAIFDWGNEIAKDTPPYEDKVSKKRMPGGLEGVVLGLTGKTADAVAAWDLNVADDITVVLYHKLKVVKKWTFIAGAMTEEHVKEILAATEAELKKK